MDFEFFPTFFFYNSTVLKIFIDKSLHILSNNQRLLYALYVPRTI